MGHFYLTTTLRLTTGDRFAGCDTSNNSLFNRKLKQKLRRLSEIHFAQILVGARQTVNFLRNRKLNQKLRRLFFLGLQRLTLRRFWL